VQLRPRLCVLRRLRRAVSSCRKPDRGPSTAHRRLLRLPLFVRPRVLVPVPVASSGGVQFSIAVPAARAVRVDRVQVWGGGQEDQAVQVHGVRCILPALRPVAPVDQGNVRGWALVQVSEHVQDLGSAPVWVARPAYRLQAKRRVPHVQDRVAVDGRVTRRPKKVR
jgi:hypothetical protein